jgi:hypothetical protein
MNHLEVGCMGGENYLNPLQLFPCGLIQVRELMEQIFFAEESH